MRWFIAPIVFSLVWVCAAHGVVYNLAADFSDVNNPSGAWSYRRATTLLPHNNNASANAINAVATNGFWGESTDYNSSILKTTGSGSAAGSGYTDNDFLAGDVLSHSTNPSTFNDDPVNVAWTAPSAGTVLYSGSVWYAHSVVTRSNDFAFTLNNGAPLASGTVGPAQNRPNAITFSNGVALPVLSGDKLILTLKPTAAQSFGSIAGISLNVNFTAVPEPASVGLLTAAAGSALMRRARRLAVR